MTRQGNEPRSQRRHHKVLTITPCSPITITVQNHQFLYIFPVIKKEKQSTREESPSVYYYRQARNKRLIFHHKRWPLSIYNVHNMVCSNVTRKRVTWKLIKDQSAPHPSCQLMSANGYPLLHADISFTRTPTGLWSIWISEERTPAKFSRFYLELSQMFDLKHSVIP